MDLCFGEAESVAYSALLMIYYGPFSRSKREVFMQWN